MFICLIAVITSQISQAKELLRKSKKKMKVDNRDKGIHPEKWKRMSLEKQFMKKNNSSKLKIKVVIIDQIILDRGTMTG